VNNNPLPLEALQTAAAAFSEFEQEVLIHLSSLDPEPPEPAPAPPSKGKGEKDQGPQRPKSRINLFSSKTCFHDFKVPGVNSAFYWGYPDHADSMERKDSCFWLVKKGLGSFS
jgi:hypothetical protein